ncbi:glycosyltransferase [Limimonas halophila]|nr:glycosyltransferase [Limimonas halophila]
MERSCGKPRAVIVSPRGLTHQLSRCCSYEFEDAVAAMEDADLYTPVHTRSSRFLEKLRNRLADGTAAYRLVPTGTAIEIERNYEIGFFLVQFARDLVSFDMIRRWRQRTRIAVCVIEELWAADIERFRHKLKRLQAFDHVFCGCAGSVARLSAAIGRPVHYLPPGVDALKFAPNRDDNLRAIDVCAIGRQSRETHRALVQLSREAGLYYHHDTLVGPFTAREPSEHRRLLANTIKHSRYFLANTAKIDQAHETQHQAEVGFRFFEGMAGGAVLLGTPPKTPVFDELFDWPDAVIEIPFHHSGIGETLAELDRQPERLTRIRRDNLTGILRRHDWLYRWRRILEHAGLPETRQMALRERELERLKQRIVSTAGAPTRPNGLQTVIGSNHSVTPAKT